jgi:hypothetical protein
MAHVLELLTGDTPDSWADAGFTVDDGTCTVGTVRIVLAGPDAGKGIVAWTVAGLDAPTDAGQIDGLPTTFSADPPDARTNRVDHPNGVSAIDHLVLLSPDVDRTVEAFDTFGLDARRERRTDTYGAPMRQVFFRAGEVIVELVGPEQPMGDGPSGFFGLAYTVADLDATAALLGERLGEAKDAVQPGRRIATLRTKALGMRVATAFMSPDPQH